MSMLEIIWQSWKRCRKLLQIKNERCGTCKQSESSINGAVMLSGVLQRNAKPEARLSNISDQFQSYAQSRLLGLPSHEQALQHVGHRNSDSYCAPVIGAWVR